MCTSCEWNARGLLAAAMASVVGGKVSKILDPHAPWSRRAADAIVSAGVALVAVGYAMPKAVLLVEEGMKEEPDAFHMFRLSLQVTGYVLGAKLMANHHLANRTQYQ